MGLRLWGWGWVWGGWGWGWVWGWRWGWSRGRGRFLPALAEPRPAGRLRGRRKEAEERSSPAPALWLSVCPSFWPSVRPAPRLLRAQVPAGKEARSGRSPAASPGRDAEGCCPLLTAPGSAPCRPPSLPASGSHPAQSGFFLFFFLIKVEPLIRPSQSAARCCG